MPNSNDGGVQRVPDKPVVPVAELMRVYGNTVWIESDLLGDRHVMVQSEAPGAEPHCFCSLRYDHRYTSNSHLDQVAERVALLLGALAPVARRVRDVPISTPTGSNAIRDIPAQKPRVENGAVQFGDDWPGVFIRGDSAGYYAMTLHALLQPPADKNSATTGAIARIQLGGLYNLLRGCVVGPANGLFPPRTD